MVGRTLKRRRLPHRSKKREKQGDNDGVESK